ncbi:hypothetical protein SDC9_202052 [bioreactor metagenome]|uniref:Uncharacterized protein n=1 Tax=bioreactor metagenome TaxID=1076179 RepID=A0A645IU59_9ZZZZ
MTGIESITHRTHKILLRDAFVYAVAKRLGSRFGREGKRSLSEAVRLFEKLL